MKGGTLVVSRDIKNFTHYKVELEKIRFNEVTCTAAEKDALISIIREMKPSLMIINARFYQRSTPYKMGRLLKIFPWLIIAAISLDEYPPELAMYFIRNGVKSYGAYFDGIDELKKCILTIRDGGKYVSPAVTECMNKREEELRPASDMTDYYKEIILLTSNGFKDEEIGDIMQVTRRTISTHKSEIYRSLNVRNENELIKVAQDLGIIEQRGMSYFPKDFVVSPLPDKIKGRRKKAK